MEVVTEMDYKAILESLADKLQADVFQTVENAREACEVARTVATLLEEANKYK